MNTPNGMNTNDGGSANEHAFRRLEMLRAGLNEQWEMARRRQAAILLLMGVMACVMTFGLSQVNTLAHSLDAATLARLGGQQAVDNLPQGREALQAALAEKAPDLVADTLQAAVNSLPSIRAMMVEEMHASLDQANDDFVAATIGQLQRGMWTAKLAIDQSDPDASDQRKMMLVTKTAMKDFERYFDQALDELYPTYAMQMTQMTEYLDHLSSSDEDQLDASERRKREIIETVLQLIVRFRDGEKVL